MRRPHPVPTHTGPVLLTRKWSTFLLLVGVFAVAVWPRFALAIWQDQRAWTGPVAHSTPTAFLWVHAVLIVTAMALGLTTGYLGIRGLTANRSRSGAVTDPAARDGIAR